MKKKLFALALCLLVVVVMAVPAFADWTLEPAYAFQLSQNRLNIYGNTSSPMQGRPLTLWAKGSSASFDQMFTVVYSTCGGKNCMYLTREQSGTYAINRASYSAAGGKAAIMWSLSDGQRDSAFKMPEPDENKLVNLLNYNEGLSYVGDYSGATVYFRPGGSGPWLASGAPAL